MYSCKDEFATLQPGVAMAAHLLDSAHWIINSKWRMKGSWHTHLFLAILLFCSNPFSANAVFFNINNVSSDIVLCSLLAEGHRCCAGRNMLSRTWKVAQIMKHRLQTVYHFVKKYISGTVSLCKSYILFLFHLQTQQNFNTEVLLHPLNFLPWAKV